MRKWAILLWWKLGHPHRHDWYVWHEDARGGTFWRCHHCQLVEYTG